MNLKMEMARLTKGFRALRFYAQCVKPGNLCFDIGANRGSRSLIFTLLGARTVAVEPNPCITGFLRKVPRVVTVHQAVSNIPGSHPFLQNANDQLSTLNPNWRFKWPEFPNWRERNVECSTLDQLITRFGRPDFIKIDVEGHEVAVLEGLTQPISRLSFEASPDSQDQTLACIHRLIKLGDYEFNYSRGDEFTWALPSWRTPQHFSQQAISTAGDVYARLVS